MHYATFSGGLLQVRKIVGSRRYYITVPLGLGPC